MLVTPCPRCHESVRIPDRLLSGQVAATAQVQCPWCLSTLDRQEIESAMPPALIVVGDDFSPSDLNPSDLNPADPSTELDADNEAPAALGGGALYSAAPELESQSSELGNDSVIEESAIVTEAETMDSVSSAEEDDLDEFILPENQAPPNAEVESDKAPMAIYTSDKTRRKKKSMLKTVGSPILGALLALPIGGGLLWYLDALPNLGFYPLDGTYNSSNQFQRSAAAPVNPGGYVPPILEDSTDGPSLDAELNDDSSDSTTTTPPVELDTSEADMVPANDPATVALAELTEVSPPSDETSTEGDFEMPPEDTPQLPSEEPSVTEVAKPPMESTASPANGPMDLPALTDEQPTEEQPLNGLPGLPPAIKEVVSEDSEMPASSETTNTATANDTLSNSINEIDLVLNRLERIDAEDPKYGQAVSFAYGMLSRLSAETSPENYDQLQPLVDRIKSNKSLFVSFARQVPAWIGTPKEDRKTDGAFILGKFVATQESDGYQVRLMDGKAYPVTFANDVEAQTITAVALGNLNVSDEPASFEINWIQPAQ